MTTRKICVWPILGHVDCFDRFISSYFLAIGLIGCGCGSLAYINEHINLWLCFFYLWWIILATYSILKNFMILARLFEHVLQGYLQAILPSFQSCTCHVMMPPREHWVWKSQNHSPRPTLPLSQLGHCLKILRPPNGREASKFWISRVGRKKK